MPEGSALLTGLGGEAGCKRLATAFYARVGRDPVLRPLFPGKTLKCAIEEFAAFLIQFFDGDEDQTQRRWWLSLRESHARFRIGAAERGAWLKHMRATLDAAALDEQTRTALRQFFEHSSGYIVGNDSPQPEGDELAARWRGQLRLDVAVAAIAEGRDEEAIAMAPRFTSRSSVFVGLLARMLQSGRPDLIRFVVESVERDPSLSAHRFAGRTLLHYASGAGCLPMVELLLRLGTDPDVPDAGGHPPLYAGANECGSDAGPAIVRALVKAGADVNAARGVMRTTALHTAARRGHLEIARTLLDCGASIEVADRKGNTPLERAVNCRKLQVAQLLRDARGSVTC